MAGVNCDAGRGSMASGKRRLPRVRLTLQSRVRALALSLAARAAWRRAEVAELVDAHDSGSKPQYKPLSYVTDEISKANAQGNFLGSRARLGVAV